ncbi:hypothetical protein [Dipodfec virus UOA04_Rod_1058]|nr:hypothetical protein [Dipodfec virus UOA04_Rod_1058]
MFKTQFNYNDFGVDLEAANSHSESIPDMSFSVKEILARFTRGTLDPKVVERNVEYGNTSDSDIDNIPDVVSDITDIEDMYHRGVDALDRIGNKTMLRSHEENIDKAATQVKETNETNETE